MTQVIKLPSVITEIAALSITGWDGKSIPVKDDNAIPESSIMLCPVVIPSPDKFVEFSSPEHSSFGLLGNDQLIIRYKLTYKYLHATIAGGVGGLFTVYSGLVQNIGLISAAMLNAEYTNAPIVHIDHIGNIGVITDPAGNQYWGCDFVIEVQEFSPQVSAKSAVILVDDSTGTLRTISTDVYDYEILYDVTPVDVTTMEDGGENFIWVRKVNGLKLTVLWNPTATTGAFTVLKGIVGSATSKTVSIKPDPAGQTFSGEFLCTGIHPKGEATQAPIRLGVAEFLVFGSTMPAWA